MEDDVPEDSPFVKLPGARVTLAPWAECDGPSVVAAAGHPAQAIVLRRLPLHELLQLAGAHIEDLSGDEVLVRELERRAEHTQ